MTRAVISVLPTVIITGVMLACTAWLQRVVTASRGPDQTLELQRLEARVQELSGQLKQIDKSIACTNFRLVPPEEKLRIPLADWPC